MGWFGFDHVREVVSGIVGGVVFVATAGNPVVAGLAAGVAGGLWAGLVDGEGLGRSILAGAQDGALSMLGGGWLGGGLKETAKVAMRTLKWPFKGGGIPVMQTLRPKPGLLGAAGAPIAIGQYWGKTGRSGNEVPNIVGIPTTTIHPEAPVNESRTNEGLGDPSPSMINLEMPDNRQMNGFPERYRLRPRVEANYRKMPDFFLMHYKRFAKGSKLPPPTRVDAPQFVAADVGDSGEMIADYKVLVDNINRAINSFNRADEKLFGLIGEFEKLNLGDRGRRAINSNIMTLNANAKAAPADGNENMWVMKFLADAMEDNAKDMDGFETEAKGRAGGIDDVGSTFSKDVIARLKVLEDAPKYSPESIAELGKRVEAMESRIAGYKPDSNSNSNQGMADQLNGAGSGSGAGAASGGDDRLLQKMDDLVNKVSGGSTTGGVMSPSGGGSGMDLGSLLPLMNMMGNGTGQQGNENDLRDRLNEDRSLRPQSPAPVQAVPTVTPQSPAGAPTTPVGPQANTPVKDPVTSNQPPAQPGNRAPDADGAVTYTFPDGKTQKVSVVVAQALDAAFGNHTSTDAKQAYSKTSAKWSDNKQIGDAADPYQLMTGDVAIWHNPDCTAIVRAMGSVTDGTLDVIINGELSPFEAKNTHIAGDFAGFAHPHGIEVTGSGAKKDDVPVLADPDAAPAPGLASPAL